MKKIILAGTIAILSVVAFAQNKITFPDFTKIIIPANFEVKLIQSQSNQVSFQNDDADNLPYSLIEKGAHVNGNTLSFDLSEFKSKIPVKLFIYVSNLQEIKLESNAKIEMGSDSAIIAKYLAIYADGAAKAALNLNVEKLTAEVNGASKLTIDGKATEGKLSANGASKIDASGMAFENLLAEANGVSKISATVKNNLKAVANGVSKIEFAGNPKNIEKEINGASKIGKINDDELGDDGKIELSIPSKKLHKHKKQSTEMANAFGGIEIGIGTLITPNMNTSLAASNKNLETNIGSSWRFAINFGDWDLPLIKGRLAFCSGIGLSFDHYGFKNKDSMISDNTKALTFQAPSATLSTNRLSQFNLTLPLLLKYNSNYNKHNNRFYFATGVIVNYTVSNSIYTEYTNNGVYYESRGKGDFFVNRLRADATARMGYSNVSIFANFGLVPMFDSAKVSDTRNLQVGLAFNW